MYLFDRTTTHGLSLTLLDPNSPAHGGLSISPRVDLGRGISESLASEGLGENVPLSAALHGEDLNQKLDELRNEHCVDGDLRSRPDSGS